MCSSVKKKDKTSLFVKRITGTAVGVLDGCSRLQISDIV